MSRSEALEAAEKAGLELVEISPAASPPVAKIIDWGKYQYQKMKELQRNKKNAKQSELKQMRLGLKIGQHDLDIKLKKIRSFLADGDKRFAPLTFSAQYQRDTTVTRFFRSAFDQGTFGIVQRIDEEGYPVEFRKVELELVR